MKRCLVALALVALLFAAPSASAADATRQSAVFALIIGVNRSLDADVAPLRYADDDAARYLDLFRALGARTYLLSSLDENTRRLHPQAAAEARPARRGELGRAVSGLARDVAQARARGIRSVLYVIYAGHGDSGDDGWRLTLEDGRLDGSSLLKQVVNPAGADQAHVIVDACQAYLLAYERGPGGKRRRVGGFVELEAASRQGRVGYLLSTSTTGETHEWAGFEAGVFSHEIRSGLYGAADANADGIVSYAEIAAFVTRANAAVVNERFRPRIVARTPGGSSALLDVRGLGKREVRFEGSETAAHYLLEDPQGVRLLDFHGSRDVPLRLIRPPGNSPLYLRRLSDGTERVIPPSGEVVHLETLVAEAPRAGTRGAAHQAFSTIFSLPFDPAAVAAYERNAAAEERAQLAATERSAARSRTFSIAGWTAVGVGTAALATGGVLELSAYALSDRAEKESQAQAARRNDQIATRNLAATLFLAGGGAALGTGIALLLWDTSPPATLSVSTSAFDVSTTWRF